MSLTITVFGLIDTTTGRLGIHRAPLDRGGSANLDRPWSKIAKAIDGHGIPTVTRDPISTPHAIACQLVLRAIGTLHQDRRPDRSTRSRWPTQQGRAHSAWDRCSEQYLVAATLLEQLIRPGFDAAQGAEKIRRYVRKAKFVVMEYRKAEAPYCYPRTQVGISERRYYKLLPQFAHEVNGRYVLDQDDVVARMMAHLDRVDQVRAVRAAALDVLRAHGFGEEAARKWLQRHQPEEAVNAWPRGQRP